jgi:hypothetical protein
MSNFLAKSLFSALALVLAMAIAPAPAAAQSSGIGGGNNHIRNQGNGNSPWNYFSVRADTRRCASPLCGGYFVKAVNEGLTRCADGSWAEECYVAEINFNRLGNVDLTEFHSSNSNLVFGRVRAKNFRVHGNLGTLVAEEAWYGADDSPFTNPGPKWSVVVDNGLRCFTYPCYFIDEEQLNTGDTSVISNVNLSSVVATQTELDAAWVLLGRDELIVAGYSALIPNEGPAGDGVTLFATQFYLPLP